MEDGRWGVFTRAGPRNFLSTSQGSSLSLSLSRSDRRRQAIRFTGAPLLLYRESFPPFQITTGLKILLREKPVRGEKGKDRVE